MTRAIDTRPHASEHVDLSPSEVRRLWHANAGLKQKLDATTRDGRERPT
jgi:hypothetical protein